MDQQALDTLKKYHDAELVDECARIAAESEAYHREWLALTQAPERIMATLAGYAPAILTAALAQVQTEREKTFRAWIESCERLDAAWTRMIESLPVVPSLAEVISHE